MFTFLKGQITKKKREERRGKKRKGEEKKKRGRKRKGKKRKRKRKRQKERKEKRRKPRMRLQEQLRLLACRTTENNTQHNQAVQIKGLVMSHGFSDISEQMSFLNRELKMANLEQDPKVEPNNTATATLTVSGAESLILEKMKLQRAITPKTIFL